MPFELPELPYPPGALAPVTSEQTISFHHGKHHAGYVANLNRLTQGTDWESQSLEDIIAQADGALFNNAAQIWNHTFFWNSMHPEGGGEPGDSDKALSAAIDQSFGSFDGFVEQFKAAAVGLFGSGWVWLVAGGNAGDSNGTGGSNETGGSPLSITTTANADLPLRSQPEATALLTLDVWEHAYYLDFQNNRPGFIEAWLEQLVNWEFAARNFTP